MPRHYYVADDLNELERVSNELKATGLSDSQVHVLSESDAALTQHHVNSVDSISKSDVIHSGFIGAAIGALFVVLIIGVGFYFNASGLEGWLPFAFLAMVVFGFCTWEGGLRGIQVQNSEYRRFSDMLKKGKHILIVDTRKANEINVVNIIAGHTQLQETATS